MRTLLALLFTASLAIAQTCNDTSSHKRQFVEVEKGIALEVLDWGGTGRPIVLLAGSGNTAHIYDDFAPTLTGFGHVYGITRRGFGASSRPQSGYSEQRLADDILSVIEQLKIAKPVLVGHSMAGEELTPLGAQHSKLLGGLVYLAAGADPTDFPASNKEYMELAHRLPKGMQGGPPATEADHNSVQAMSRWLDNRVRVHFPIGEICAANVITREGRVEDFPDEERIHKLIGDGAQKRDYSHVSVPILDFVDGDCPAKPQTDVVCIENHKLNYVPKNDQERSAIDAFWAATDIYIYRWMDQMREAKAPVRFIDIPRSNHYVFLSNTAEVTRELESFFKGL
ncbi:MAG TPA: alpha/beta hydrolase [Candidatus Nanopelagicaceae bacterium]